MKAYVSILVAVLLAPVLAIAGCRHKGSPPAGVTAASRGIVVSQARLVLPVVKGNPGAAYFTLGNPGSAPATLVSVDIEGAKQSEMHDTSGGSMLPLTQVRIDPGQRAIFAPGGRHAMVFNLAPSLTPGGSSEITFHFRNGKTTSAPLRIESGAGGDIGGNMAGMPGMNTDGKP